jgi:peptide chain release factor 1
MRHIVFVLGRLWSVFEFSDSCLIYKISGNDVSSKFSLESGIHRVQRVPPTEAQGRRHTSTIAVAVLPFIAFDPQYKEADFNIECKVGSGKGGQHRNKTMSTVKVTHKATGMNVTIDSRCQHTNKQEAMAILISRLKEKDENLYNNSANQDRVSQIGNMGRGARVRTYNFIEDRTKDERVGKKFRTQDIMDGKIDLIYNEIKIKCEDCKLFIPYEGGKIDKDNCVTWLCNDNGCPNDKELSHEAKRRSDQNV